MARPTDVFGAITRRETEVVGQPVTDVVTVQKIGDIARLDERALDGDRECRLAGGGQSGEPDRGAALTRGVPPMVTVKRRGMPADVVPGLHTRLHLAGFGDGARADRVVGGLVDKDERSAVAVVDVWVRHHHRT